QHVRNSPGYRETHERNQSPGWCSCLVDATDWGTPAQGARPGRSPATPRLATSHDEIPLSSVRAELTTARTPPPLLARPSPPPHPPPRPPAPRGRAGRELVVVPPRREGLRFVDQRIIPPPAHQQHLPRPHVARQRPQSKDLRVRPPTVLDDLAELAADRPL